MKLGIGFYRNMLTADNFRFAKQAGASHIVAHLTDYFQDPNSLSTGSGGSAWGVTKQKAPWSYEELRDLQAMAKAEGVEIAALENFDPAFWYDVLLDGPRRAEQMEGLKSIIRSMGRAGIGIMGYNFSIAGVWGRMEGEFARGKAKSVGFVSALTPPETPIPNGTVWNMIYDPSAPPGEVGPVSADEIWRRVSAFLQEIVPVAEEAGVRLAVHPDDPPFPALRGAARLVYHPDHFQRLLDVVPSPSNSLEFCLGTISEMTGGDVYEATERYSRAGKIGYVHFRNVRGKVPNYQEVFVDEGDMNMMRIMRILHETHFDGVVIPDHTPQMQCAAPWHAGMAYALGWMRAALSAVERM